MEVGAGLLVVGVAGAVVGLEGGVVVAGLLVVDVGTLVGVEDTEESLKERYQFERSVSPRHSPTVTPFQPLAWIRS